MHILHAVILIMNLLAQVVFIFRNKEAIFTIHSHAAIKRIIQCLYLFLNDSALLRMRKMRQPQWAINAGSLEKQEQI